MKTTLACACLALFATAAFAAPLSAFQSIRQATVGSADFCRGTPCPDFEVEKTTSNYELRKYEPTAWATVQASGSYYKASSQGLAELLRYTSGANDDQESLPATKPLTLIFKADEDFSKVDENFTVAYYLAGKDEDSAPKPTDANIKVISAPGGEAYVKTFSGFATQASILKTAKTFSEELKADGVESGSTFFFALYDGPQILINRHNEIWFMEKSA